MLLVTRGRKKTYQRCQYINTASIMLDTYFTLSVPIIKCREIAMSAFSPYPL